MFHVRTKTDAKVVPVVLQHLKKNANSEMKTPIVQRQTIANFTLAKVGILYNLGTDTLWTGCPDSVRRLTQICFA